MSELYDILKPESKYYDRKNYDSQASYDAALSTSATVYVGNLSFFTTQDAVRELFSRTGQIKEIIMGIDNQGNPCGFCFVEYETHQQAQLAVEYISKTRLNDRTIRVDWDPGYKEGREKGRGSNGQQRRDDFRNKEDAERPRKRVNTGQYSGSRSYEQSEGKREYRGHRGDSRGYHDSRRDRDDSKREYRERREHREPRGDYRGGDRSERRDDRNRSDDRHKVQENNQY